MKKSLFIIFFLFSTSLATKRKGPHLTIRFDGAAVTLSKPAACTSDTLSDFLRYRGNGPFKYEEEYGPLSADAFLSLVPDENGGFKPGNGPDQASTTQGLFDLATHFQFDRRFNRAEIQTYLWLMAVILGSASSVYLSS